MNEIEKQIDNINKEKEKSILELLKDEKVEWKKLEEIKSVVTITPIKKYKKTEYKQKGKYPIIDQGQEFIVGYTDSEEIFPKDEYIIFGDHTEVLKYVDFSFAQGADGIKVIKIIGKDILPKFLYYSILNFYKKTGEYKRHFSKLKKTLIPIPRIEIQEKIVKILDKFTKYVTELQAELQARNKQYIYYRDLLLSEDYLTKLTQKTKKEYPLRVTTLGEIGKVCMCRRILKEQTSDVGEIPFYKIGTFGKIPDAFISRKIFEEYKNKYSYPKKGDILISASGTIGRTVIYTGEDSYYQDSNIVWLNNDEKIILNNYLYYFYSINPWKSLSGGTIKRLYNSDIEKLKIIVPPIEIQEKVVLVLNKFQKLIDETNGLLPEEIEQRKKQYEYYREKLLTFDLICDNQSINQSINQF